MQNVVVGHITKNKQEIISKAKYTSHCDFVDVMTGNYNDGVCEGNAYTKDNWEKRCCGKHCKVNRCFEDSRFPNSLRYWSISIIVVQFNGTRCLLQGYVLINRRYLSLASLLLPMTVAMTLSQ